MVVVATENGIEIECDEAGKFSAFAYGQRCEDRSLSKVKKWTATVKPTVSLMQVDGNDSYRTRRGFRVISNIVDVRQNSRGELLGYGPSNATSSRSRYADYQPSYDKLYVPNEEVQEKIKALNEQLGQWQKEVHDRYTAAFEEIVSTLEPITEEKFAELLKEQGVGR